MSALNELQSRVEQTANHRFIASRRLKYHQRFSTWVVALSSLAILLVPSFGVLGATRLSAEQINAIEAVLAAFVLVYSLLLGLEDYSLQSDRLHRCGIDLSSLSRRLERLSEIGITDKAFSEALEEYTMILKGFDNHNYLDVLLYRLQKKRAREWAPWELFATRVSVAGRILFGFLHYLLMAVFICAAVVTVLMI